MRVVIVNGKTSEFIYCIFVKPIEGFKTIHTGNFSANNGHGVYAVSYG